jgi:uncharacterized protein (TIRG00374 family)
MTDHDSPTPAEPSGTRQALIWALKIVVSGGLLYVLLTNVDLAQLWRAGRSASPAWLAAALGLYFVMILISAWRWRILLAAQHIAVPFKRLTNSLLVATFFNNFLPSNIGGDVIRIRDTARQAGSKTLATTVVLLDRGLGLFALLFVAATGATLAARSSATIGPVGPGVLWVGLVGGLAIAAPALLMPARLGQMLRPLRALHREWVDVRIERLTTALAKFGDAPRAIITCFAGAVAVQGGIVLFYAAIARALHIPIPIGHLAILILISSIVQMLPLSIAGFGVREATFSFYFSRLALPLESALALSFMGAALIMVYSVIGAITYAGRRTSPA